MRFRNIIGQCCSCGKGFERIPTVVWFGSHPPEQDDIRDACLACEQDGGCAIGRHKVSQKLICSECVKMKSMDDLIKLDPTMDKVDHLTIAKAKAHNDSTFDFKVYLSTIPILAELEAERTAAVKRGEALLKKRKCQQLVSDTWEIIRGIVYIAFWTGVAFVVFWLWADR